MFLADLFGLCCLVLGLCIRFFGWCDTDFCAFCFRFRRLGCRLLFCFAFCGCCKCGFVGFTCVVFVVRFRCLCFGGFDLCFVFCGFMITLVCFWGNVRVMVYW